MARRHRSVVMAEVVLCIALHNGHRGVSDWIKQDFIHTEHSHELHRDGMAQVVRSELELCE